MPLKATISVTVRFPRAACEAIDLFAGTTYPGATREAVIKLIVADYLAQRAADPAGTAQRQGAWNRSLKEAFDAAAAALRQAAERFAMRADEINGRAPPSGGYVFDDGKRAA